MINFMKTNTFLLCIFTFVFLIFVYLLDGIYNLNSYTFFIIISLSVFLNVKKLHFQFENKRSAILFILLSVYLTFAFFGYEFFITGGRRPTLGFFLGLLWTPFILQAALYALNFFANRPVKIPQTTEGSGKHFWRKWLLLFGIGAAVLFIYQIAFSPAILSWDSLYQLNEALSNEPITDYHTPVYTFVLRLLLWIIPSVAFVAAVQVLCMAALFAACLMFLYQKGVPFIYLVLAAAIIPALPNNGLHGITLWKDIPFSLAMLWLTLSIVKVVDSITTKRAVTNSYSLAVQICLALVAIFFFRHNGVLVYYVTAAALTALFICIRNWRLLIGIGASVVLILLIYFPLYNIMNVERSNFPQRGRYFALVNDMQHAYYNGAILSDSSLSKIRRIIPTIDDEGVREAHNLYWTHYPSFELDDMTLGAFIGFYLDVFFDNPRIMTQTLLRRMVHYWSIDARFVPGAANHRHGYSAKNDAEEIQYFFPHILENINVYRNPNLLTPVFLAVTNLTGHRLGLTIFWWLGIWVALMFITIYFYINKRSYLILLAHLPAAVLLLSLYIASTASDYRFGYPLFLISMFTTALAVVYRKGNGHVQIR